ncbi:MAG: lysophospholipid acyltransferase family protein [Pseudomonadota bacterium]
MARLGDRLGRWLRGSGTGQFLSSHLGALYIRLVVRTTRWQFIGREHYQEACDRPGGVIAAFWHGRLFMAPTWPARHRRAVAMISNNRDGDLIAAIVRRFGALAVRGSTNDRAKARDKGGAEAFAAAHRELTENEAMLGVTPDGPRGPRMRVQPGVALLSIQTGIPITPVTFSTVKGKTLRNWDRFLVPFPFGRGVQIVGAPVLPPPQGTPQALSRHMVEIERVLNEITAEADRLCGRPPTEPAPPSEPSVTGA